MRLNTFLGAAGSADQLRATLLRQGLIDSNNNVIGNPAHIWSIALAYGFSASELDAALGWNPGTTDAWLATQATTGPVTTAPAPVTTAPAPAPTTSTYVGTRTRVQIIEGQPVYQYLRSAGAIDVNGIPMASVTQTYSAAANGGFSQSTVYYGLNWGTAEARALFIAAGLSVPNAPTTQTGVQDSRVSNPNSTYEMLRSGTPELNKIASVISSWIRDSYVNWNLEPTRYGLTYADVYQRALSSGGWGGYTVAGELMRVWELTGQYSLAQYYADTGGTAPTSPTAPTVPPIVDPMAPTQPVPAIVTRDSQVSTPTTSIAPTGPGTTAFPSALAPTTQAIMNPDGTISYVTVTTSGPMVNNPQPAPVAVTPDFGKALALLIAALTFLK